MIPILADAGLPMIAVEYPFMLLGLVPIVIVEIAVARWRLGMKSKHAMTA